jgi:hypothetical protein
MSSSSPELVLPPRAYEEKGQLSSSVLLVAWTAQFIQIYVLLLRMLKQAADVAWLAVIG